MSVDQQTIIDALVPEFQTATGISAYDTFAPDDKAYPYCVVKVQNDVPDNAFGRTESAHNITFLVTFYKLKQGGPASIRAYADLAFNALNRTRLDIDDKQNEVECIDRGGPDLRDTDVLELVMTWTYKGSF